MGMELEFKFAADEKILANIAKEYPGGECLQMTTSYYDTSDGALSGKRYTLRWRVENDTHICTVKTPMPNNCRGEWEVEESDIQKAIPRLCALGAPENLLIITRKGVIPICGARFTRQAVPIEQADFSAELAMDTGILTGADKEIPLCEVELEYKSGDMDAFFAFTEIFQKTYQLRPEPLSKFSRAFNLYLGEK